MRGKAPSAIALAIEALSLAEERLRALPPHAAVRSLQARVLAMTTVVSGMMEKRLAFTVEQQERFVCDARDLAQETARLLQRSIPPEE